MAEYTFSIAFRLWRWGGGIQTAPPYAKIESLKDEPWLVSPSFGFHVGFFARESHASRMQEKEIRHDN
jgi:hypothetical protein